MKLMRALTLLLLVALIGCTEDKLQQQRTDEAVQLHPDFPVVEDLYQMTKEWSVSLPSKFNRRMEDDDLVIWQPGFTIWTTVWNNDKSERPEERLAWIKHETITHHNTVTNDHLHAAALCRGGAAEG